MSPRAATSAAPAVGRHTGVAGLLTEPWGVLVAATLLGLAAFLLGSLTGAFAIPAGYTAAHLGGADAEVVDGAVARNNVTLAIGIVMLGVATVGVGPLVVLFVNGLIVGQLVRVLADDGMAGAILTGLLPHALLELLGLAVVYGAACVVVTQFLAWVARVPTSTTRAEASLLSLTAVGAGLLLLSIAAYVEDHVSVVEVVALM